jgi:hypothetical protein
MVLKPPSTIKRKCMIYRIMIIPIVNFMGMDFLMHGKGEVSVLFTEAVLSSLGAEDARLIHEVDVAFMRIILDVAEAEICLHIIMIIGKTLVVDVVLNQAWVVAVIQVSGAVII